MPSKLISAAEVISLAFPNQNVRTEWIKDDIIEIAQESFIMPVLGTASDGSGLYDYLIATDPLAGDYATLNNNYIKPALAFYVKYLIVPELFAQIGNAGLMNLSVENAQQVSSKDKEVYRTQCRKDADVLLSKMIRYLKLDANSTKFPEWVPGDNIKNDVSYTGGIIIRKRGRKNTNKYW